MVMFSLVYIYRLKKNLSSLIGFFLIVKYVSHNFERHITVVLCDLKKNKSNHFYELYLFVNLKSKFRVLIAGNRSSHEAYNLYRKQKDNML